MDARTEASCRKLCRIAGMRTALQRSWSGICINGPVELGLPIDDVRAEFRKGHHRAEQLLAALREQGEEQGAGEEE